MPWQIKKDVEHGASNPIVARLSLQVFEILKQTTAAKSKEKQDAIGTAFHELMKKMLTCYEIRERFRAEFNKAVAAIDALKPGAKVIEVPQILRLDAEARHFVYEAKTIVRDILQTVNLLHGTTFEEASEFTNAAKKKGAVSFLDFVKQTYGDNELAAEELKKAGALVNHVIALRNAAEHPDGYSGTLVIKNFELAKDGFSEPTWHRIKDGKEVHSPSSIREDYERIVDGLMIVAEEVFIGWAGQNLLGNGMMVLVRIPDAEINPEVPVHYRVTLNPTLAQRLGKPMAG